MQIGSRGELLHEHLECVNRFRRVLLQHNRRHIARRFNQRIFGRIHFLRQQRDTKQGEAERGFGLLRNSGLPELRTKKSRRAFEFACVN